MFFFLNLLYCSEALDLNRKELSNRIICLVQERNDEINEFNNLIDIIIRNQHLENYIIMNCIEKKRSTIQALNNEIYLYRERLIYDQTAAKY